MSLLLEKFKENNLKDDIDSDCYKPSHYPIIPEQLTGFKARELFISYFSSNSLKREFIRNILRKIDNIKLFNNYLKKEYYHTDEITNEVELNYISQKYFHYLNYPNEFNENCIITSQIPTLSNKQSKNLNKLLIEILLLIHNLNKTFVCVMTDNNRSQFIGIDIRRNLMSSSLLFTFASSKTPDYCSYINNCDVLILDVMDSEIMDGLLSSDNKDILGNPIDSVNYKNSKTFYFNSGYTLTITNIDGINIYYIGNYFNQKDLVKNYSKFNLYPSLKSIGHKYFTDNHLLMRRLKERLNKDNYRNYILDNKNKEDFVYRRDPVGMAKEDNHSKYIK